MKKINLFNSLYFYLIIVFIIGCKKNDINNNHSSGNAFEDAKLVLYKKGIDTVGIYEKNGYYIVEKDVLIPKSYIKTLPRQAYGGSSFLISTSKQSYITVAIDTSMPTGNVPLNWRNEVSLAIDKYNAIPYCSIKMRLISGTTADIVIKVGATNNSNAYAEAPLPTNGNPGYQIMINNNFTGPAYAAITSSTQKLSVLMHEFGHTIGMGHTNWYQDNSWANIGIGNSPNSSATNPSPDNFSVFNSSLQNFTDFSYWDKYAISYLYPITNPVIMATTGSRLLGFSYGYPYSGGKIYAPSGYNVRVNISATGSWGYNWSLNVNISGASVTGNNSVTNGSSYFTFYMPSSGEVNWSGSFSSQNSMGGGEISVQ